MIPCSMPIRRTLATLGVGLTLLTAACVAAPGSSGGPIFDRNGLLVGIVRARLLSTSAVNAQNVNFGINLATVQSFLDAHAVDYALLSAPPSTPPSVSDMVAAAQRSTVQIECY